MNPILLRSAAGAALLMSSGLALAVPLSVSSYDMPNGDGQAHGGTYNYWDGTYNGSGSRTVDGSPLTGGLGALTDGVIASIDWNLVSNDAGTGLYVGWRQPNPTITFHFASTVEVNEVRLYADNSHFGGVTAPDAVTINGVSHANPSWSSASLPQTIDITGLNFLGDTLVVELSNPTFWVFLSEVQFEGQVSAVPEPQTYALMLAGLGVVGAAARRRRRA